VLLVAIVLAVASVGTVAFFADRVKQGLVLQSNKLLGADLMVSGDRPLPPAYAEVVSLRYAGERSFAEIAQILDCDEGAARVRFHRAKSLLRHQLRALVG